MNYKDSISRAVSALSHRGVELLWVVKIQSHACYAFLSCIKATFSVQLNYHRRFNKPALNEVLYRSESIQSASAIQLYQTFSLAELRIQL